MPNASGPPTSPSPSRRTPPRCAAAAIGVLDWALVATFTAGTMAGSVAGTRMAGRVSSGMLKRAFAFLLLGVSAFILVQSGQALVA